MELQNEMLVKVIIIFIISFSCDTFMEQFGQMICLINREDFQMCFSSCMSEVVQATHYYPREKFMALLLASPNENSYKRKTKMELGFIYHSSSGW